MKFINLFDILFCKLLSLQLTTLELFNKNFQVSYDHLFFVLYRNYKIIQYNIYIHTHIDI